MLMKLLQKFFHFGSPDLLTVLWVVVVIGRSLIRIQDMFGLL